MRQLTALNRRVANVRFPLASHLPCSFAAILAGPGIARPALAWTTRAVRRPGPGCPRAQELASGPLPFLRLRSSNPRPHSPASLRATPRPDRPPPPLGSTGISASAPSRASPSTQLIGTSSVRWGEPSAGNQSDPHFLFLTPPPGALARPLTAHWLVGGL